MTDTGLLVELFTRLPGMTPQTIIAALRKYTEWRIVQARLIRIADQVTQFQALLETLPEVV